MASNSINNRQKAGLCISPQKTCDRKWANLINQNENENSNNVLVLHIKSEIKMIKSENRKPCREMEEMQSSCIAGGRKKCCSCFGKHLVASQTCMDLLYTSQCHSLKSKRHQGTPSQAVTWNACIPNQCLGWTLLLLHFSASVLWKKEMIAQVFGFLSLAW